MSRSNRLQLRDVRAVFRVVGEIQELGRDPAAWQTHLGVQCARLVDAKVSIVQETLLEHGTPCGIAGSIDQGWSTDRERAGFLQYLADFCNPEYGTIPYWDDFWRQVSLRPHVVRRRQDLVDDQHWFHSKHVNVQRRADDVNEFIYATCALKGLPGVHQLGVHRSWSAPRFTRRERRIVQLLHAELARFWKKPSTAMRLATLPPRWRQTLQRLAEGLSEKEVAQRLGVSRHTVHHYVRGLHERFQVSSRSELLATLHSLELSDRFRPRLALDSSIH